jgi:hypothetical protein
MRRIERTMLALEARVGRLRNGSEPPAENGERRSDAEDRAS